MSAENIPCATIVDETSPSARILAVEKTKSEKEPGGIHWFSLLREEFTVVSFMHLERVVMEPKTRSQIGGPYFKDWFTVLGQLNLDRWSDGGKFFTNDVAHPMGGAVYAFVYKHNDSRSKYLQFDLHDPEYLKTLNRAFWVAAITSAEFEIGPLSEATIGHVGLYRLPDGGNGTGWTDFIMTPVGGVGVMMTEDAIDRYVVTPLSHHLHNFSLMAVTSALLTPSHSFANVMTFHTPWYRDGSTEQFRTGKVPPPTLDVR